MIRHHPVALGVLLLAAPLFAVASAESLPSPLGSLMQVALSLGVVLALIWGLAWLVRRVGQVGPAGARVVRQVGGTLVGGRERVVVVEVAGRWLVLGVTAQQVSCLHVLPVVGKLPEEVRGASLSAGPSFAHEMRVASADAGKSAHV